MFKKAPPPSPWRYGVVGRGEFGDQVLLSKHRTQEAAARAARGLQPAGRVLELNTVTRKGWGIGKSVEEHSK